MDPTWWIHLLGDGRYTHCYAMYCVCQGAPLPSAGPCSWSLRQTWRRGRTSVLLHYMLPIALRRPLLLVSQTDVTARTLLEMAMAKITEREFDMLGQVGVCALIDRAGDWRGGGAKGKGGCAVMRQV